MRQHTLVGDRILSAAPAMSAVAEMVRASHERFDGAGYPDGLAGALDPARRPDRRGVRRLPRDDRRPALPRRRRPDAALHELRRCSGAQFDPEVVDAFCDLLAPAAATAARGNTDLPGRITGR